VNEPTSETDETLILRALLRELNVVKSFSEACDAAVELLARSLQVRNVAIFLKNGDVSAQGKDSEAARNSLLTGLSDPLVDRCFQGQKKCRLEATESSPIFRNDTEALAYPMEFGVVYVGGHGAAQENRLGILISSLERFLNAVSERLTQSAQLEHFRALAEAQQRTLEAYEKVAHAIPQAATTLNRQALLALFGDRLNGLLNPQYSLLLDSGGQIIPLTRGDSPAEVATEQERSLRELAGLGASTPILLLDIQTSRFASLANLGTGLVAAEVHSADKSYGHLFAFSHRGQPFGEQHRRALAFAAELLGLALTYQKLHAAFADAQAELSQASRLSVVGQLAAGVAHELNNPLGSVLLAIDSCQHFLQSKPEVAASVLNDAREAVERAQKIVGHLLYFARDAAKGRKTVSMETIVNDTLGVMEPHYRKNQLELVIRGRVPEGRLYCNPGELAQVLQELLLNAADAALSDLEAPQKVELEVTSTEQEWSVSVRDYGPGVNPENVEKIFDPFFTTKPVGKGTGLGLSVALQLVESHQGKLRLEAVDQGSLFRFTLPRRP
jgi:two-component system, NtrC family, sensor kinase